MKIIHYFIDLLNTLKSIDKSLKKLASTVADPNAKHLARIRTVEHKDNY